MELRTASTTKTSSPDDEHADRTLHACATGIREREEVLRGLDELVSHRSDIESELTSGSVVRVVGRQEREQNQQHYDDHDLALL